jgi:hypothetical protein
MRNVSYGLDFERVAYEINQLKLALILVHGRVVKFRQALVKLHNIRLKNARLGPVVRLSFVIFVVLVRFKSQYAIF